MKTIETSGKIWTLRSDLENITHWSSDWCCSDGDSVELYVEKDKSGFELRCFSGIPGSKIWVDSIDFNTLWLKVCQDKNYTSISNIEFFKKTFEEQSIILADWLCSKFCEFNDGFYSAPSEGKGIIC